ncbi:hypothetical protein VMCG_02697 [Cytospora schulzeri]|uniref:Uncharacterized protein n=1 Tax=Cytospora schulzeri TaxID=448051 RepID=A0A423WZ63_9PEZI|nr:hypothetical protein VMCG_02697 [Valsa malicola]
MLSEGSRFAQETLSPGPTSPSLSSQEATSPKAARTTRESSFSYPEQSGLKGLGFADTDGPHSSTPVASPSTPELSYLPTPPDTPESLFTGLRSEGQTLAPDLPTLPEESGIPSIPSPSPLSQEHIAQDTESASSLSIHEATVTSEPFTSSPKPENYIVQHKESSSTLSVLEATGPETVHPSPFEPDSSPTYLPGPDTHTAWRILRPLLNILAPLLNSRARAREARVRSVIRLIKAAHDGKLPSSTQPVIRRTLYPTQYQEVLDRVEAHSALRGFFHDKLR